MSSYHLLSQERSSNTDIYSQDSEAPLPQLSLAPLALAALPAHTGSQDSFPGVRGQTLRQGSVIAKVHTQLCHQIKRKCKRKRSFKQSSQLCVRPCSQLSPTAQSSRTWLGWALLVLGRSPKETKVSYIHPLATLSSLRCLLEPSFPAKEQCVREQSGLSSQSSVPLVSLPPPSSSSSSHTPHPSVTSFCEVGEKSCIMPLVPS